MKVLKSLILALFFVTSSQAVTLVAHGKCTDNPTCIVGTTGSPLNTTGTKIMFAFITAFNEVVSGSQLTTATVQTFTCLPDIYSGSGSYIHATLCWIINPTTSTTETVTFNAGTACTMTVTALDFVTTAIDKQSTFGDPTSATISAGSISPAANSLVVTAAAGFTGTLSLTTAGFTLSDNTSAADNIVAGAWFQVGSSPVNPQFTMPGVTLGFDAVVVSFAPGGSPPASGYSQVSIF